MDTERGEEFRLILVGKSGGGKSATGNTILGRRAFESILGAKVTTMRCQKGQQRWRGTKICVVDTPAMFNSEDYTETVRREIMACVELSWPGPHALILVTQVGRFTAEDVAAAKCVQHILGAESTRHTIVLFTCMEDLGGDPLQEYVQKSDNRNLRDLIRQCRNRFCGFNNKAVGAERERQISELMETVQRTVLENGGRYYVNRLYLEPNLLDEHVQMFIKENQNPYKRIIDLLFLPYRLPVWAWEKACSITRNMTNVFHAVYHWFLPELFARNMIKEAMEEEATLGEEFRLILVGKSGGGKSATGNTILGRKAFESILTAKTTTLRCQRGEGSWQNTKISVVDTPAMFDSEDYTETVRREIMACVELSRPGPHALILVTQVEHFTAEDVAAAKCVQDIFGAESTRHTILLFTCVEDLGGESLQEYVQKSDNRNLRNLIRQCGNRFCGFNNKAVGAERERQVSELMEMVQRTVLENGGRYYINRLYLEPNIQDKHVRIFIEQNRKPHESIINLLFLLPQFWGDGRVMVFLRNTLVAVIRLFFRKLFA